MATLIPSIGSANFDTRGEARLAERLKDFLEDKAFIWHNLPMGPRGRHPDFVIVHPGRGLLVLEVKDWRIDSIATANKVDVELRTPNGTVKTSSPFEQARRYMFDVMEMLRKDGQLVHPPGHPYQSKSIVPFGFGVVFANTTRRQYAATDLHEVFPEDRCIFKDEMSEKMNLHQEQVARGLGEGHWIIRGVAGSGKTLILAFRAEFLERREQARADPLLRQRHLRPT